MKSYILPKELYNFRWNRCSLGLIWLLKPYTNRIFILFWHQFLVSCAFTLHKILTLSQLDSRVQVVFFIFAISPLDFPAFQLRLNGLEWYIWSIFPSICLCHLNINNKSFRLLLVNVFRGYYSMFVCFSSKLSKLLQQPFKNPILQSTSLWNHQFPRIQCKTFPLASLVESAGTEAKYLVLMDNSPRLLIFASFPNLDHSKNR